MSALGTLPDSPFRGLMPFGESELDAVLFFGRDREREVIVANLMASRLTLLYGPSGVGKSSLLRAGVAHHLRAIAAENVARGEAPQLGVVLFSVWTEEPVAGIIRAATDEVERLTGERPSLAERADLAEALDICAAAVGGELYLVLDQVEEYFTYRDHRNGAADRFAAEFADAVDRREIRAHFVLSLREDELARLDAFKAAIPGVFGNFLRLDRLDRRAAREAIEGPLRAWNAMAAAPVIAEAALVEAVLDEVSVGRIATAGGSGNGSATHDAARIEAPYLQLVMERVWDAERAAGSTVLRAQTLAALGGAHQIVGEHLERALASLDPAEKDAAASMFTYLVTPSGSKIAHAPSDLADYAGVDQHRAEAVLAALAAQRILRPVEAPGGDGARYEIFHDVLGDEVMAWRAAYVAERRLQRERAAARRRQRQLFVIVALALLALAIVGSVALYAWDQRSEARAAAQEAEAQRAEASAAAQVAETQTAKAHHQEMIAEKEAQNAKDARDDANDEAAKAQKEQKKAETSEEKAQQATSKAEASEAAAQQTADKLEATNAALLHEQQRTKKALNTTEKAKQQATENEQLAEAKALVARVEALVNRAIARLVVEPLESVRYALQAARLRPARAENALRRSLLALRVRAILPADGADMRDAIYSPGGRYAAVATDGGDVRVFVVATGELAARLRHASAVRGIAFSPNAEMLATGSRDGSARLWRIRDGRMLRRFPHQRGTAVVSVAFTREGDQLLTAATDKRLRFWRLDGTLLRSELHAGPLVGVVVSPDGRYAVTLDALPDRRARVFALHEHSDAKELLHGGQVVAATWSVDGRFLATAGTRNVYLWDTRTWRLLHLLTGHASLSIGDIAFSRDGQRVASASGDGSARVWSTADGRTLQTLFSGTHGLTDVAFSPDGETIVTGGRDGSALLWPDPLGNPPIRLLGHTETIRSVAYSPNGETVLTASRDGTARIWSTTTDPEMRLVGAHEVGTRVNTVAVSPDGQRVLSGADDGTVRVWQLSGRPRSALIHLRHADAVTAARWVLGGQAILSASRDGTARLSTLRGRTRTVFRHGAPVVSAVWTGRGRVVTAGGARVIAWNLAGRRLWTGRLQGSVTTLGVDRRARRLAAGGSGGDLAAWRVSDGRLLFRNRVHREAIHSVAFDASGSLLVTAGEDGFSRLFSASDGQVRGAIANHEGAIVSAGFTPDDKEVYTVGDDGDVRFLDRLLGHKRTLSGHVSTVFDMQFSPDRRWVATAGPSAVGLWDLRRAGRLYFLRNTRFLPRSVAFGPDGRRVVAGGTDGTVRTYYCQLCAPVGELQRIARFKLARVTAASRRASGR